MFAIKKLSSFIVFSILFSVLLSGCALPAHKNTWYTDSDVQTVLIRVYSQDNFELNGYVVDSEGLEHQIKTLTQQSVVRRMLIDIKADATLFDQAVALQIGENYGLDTYRLTLFGSEMVRAEELLLQRDDETVFDEQPIDADEI